MNIAILILAAGKSSRMGTIKQLLPLGKTTLLGHTIESAIASKASEIYCVIGANSAAVKEAIDHYPISTIINVNYQLGLSSSIVEGMNFIKKKDYDSVLIILGDQPNVNSKYLNRLINEICEHPNKIVASSYSGTAGVPAIFPSKYHKQLRHLKGDKGAKDFLNASQLKITEIDSNDLIDIDTKQDYLDFLKTL